MVFFSCDGCGEMLKKAQVDGHANRCRRCASVSCVDCNVSFFGDDYRVHTSCVTEVERYEKRGNSSSSNKNQKLTPQQLWMNLISSSISSAPNHLQSYIRVMSTLDNVPRKEKPFYNFTSNSLKLKSNNSIVKEIWNHLCNCRKQQQQQQQSKECENDNSPIQQPRNESNAQQQTKHQQNLHEDSEMSADESRTTAISKKASETSIENVDKQESNENVVKQIACNTNDNDGMIDNSKIKSTIKSDTKVDKKVVKKLMRLEFKKAKSNALKIKMLQKCVTAQFRKEEHAQVKELFHKMIEQGKYFLKDGKIVQIKMKE